MATPQFSQDHGGANLTFGVVVRGGDVRIVEEQEPFVAMMAQVLREAFDVVAAAVFRGRSDPLVEGSFDLRAFAIKECGTVFARGLVVCFDLPF